VVTAVPRNAGRKSTVALRSVLIYDQRATAREALTHALTAAISSLIHIASVADPSDLSTAFAGNRAPDVGTCPSRRRRRQAKPGEEIRE